MALSFWKSLVIWEGDRRNPLLSPLTLEMKGPREGMRPSRSMRHDSISDSPGNRGQHYLKQLRLGFR